MNSQVASNEAKSVKQQGPDMVASGETMQEVLKTIQKIAPVEAPVMILGESGTGKEVAARQVHQLSQRSKGAFVAVNCGAIPANLIQSELFGHEKGAFTGAHQRKIGRIESADGGTIFLDEIGDLPLELQVNLLRFLQESTIERVGGTESIHIDIRVLAATHVDLQKAVAEGRFREDLFYRLNVLQLLLPPLRDRGDDILKLASTYFKYFAKAHKSPVRDFTEDAKRVMNVYAWPGNIRELINRIRRAVVMCDTQLISPSDLGLERRSDHRESILTLAEVKAKAEEQAIHAALKRNRDNIAAAARELDISRVTMYRLMEKHGLEKD